MQSRAAFFCAVLVCLAAAGCCPVITNFVPDRGPAGTEVTIDGRDFESAPAGNTVKFGGVAVPPAGVLQASPTRLRVKVPPGAVTGPISVANDTCEGTSLRAFTVASLTGKPDLLPANLAFGGDGALAFTLKNEGENEVPAGQGSLAVYVDGRLMMRKALADLPEQSFRSPGGSVSVATGVRASGANRRIAVVVDPGNAIDESNEFQNTLTRTLTPPAVAGPDLVVSDLALDTPTRLRAVIRNAGSAPSAANLAAGLEVFVNTIRVGSLDTSLPALAAGASTFVVYTAPSAIAGGSRVRVTLRTNRLADEIDNTNNSREEVLPPGPSLAPYTALLNTPGIRNSIIWEGRLGSQPRVALAYGNWSAAQKADLDSAILSLERGDPYALSAPPALIGTQMISVADAWTIYLAHVAQSLWVDVRGLVPWRLADLPDDQLLLLFDGRKLLTFWQDLYAFDTWNMGSVTAWNPRAGYEFLANLGMIRATPLETLYALTDWMRGRLVHIGGDQDKMQLYGYAGLAPADRILYALDGRRHTAEGCWGTSGLYGAVLRAVNIPVRRTDVMLDNGNHCRPHFPSVDRGLVHGDDPYSAELIPSGAVVPSSMMFFTQAQIQARFVAPPVDCAGGRCNTQSQQAAYNAGKLYWQLAYDAMADYLLMQYARYGAAYLNDSLRGPRIGGGVVPYVLPYFPDAERAAMVQAVENRVRQIGGGNLQAGKDIVINRWDRFAANR